MHTDWLATTNFEQAQDLVGAITTLSIHAKLILASVEDLASADELCHARRTLHSFLDRFGAVVTAAGRESEGQVVAADPHLEQLAVQYLAARRRLPQQTALYTLSIEQLQALIDSEQPQDLRALIPCLGELRTLVEEQAQADIVGILGDL